MNHESIVFLLDCKCPMLCDFASFISSSGAPSGRSAVDIVDALPIMGVSGVFMSVWICMLGLGPMSACCDTSF